MLLGRCSLQSAHPLMKHQGADTAGEAERVLIEDVHDAISDLVELIKTYRSKNKLLQVLMSTLFKRRQDELDAVVDRAITRLQVSGVQAISFLVELLPDHKDIQNICVRIAFDVASRMGLNERRRRFRGLFEHAALCFWWHPTLDFFSPGPRAVGDTGANQKRSWSTQERVQRRQEGDRCE